jgi:hypothetical protein
MRYLDFYVEENLDDRKPGKFWLEVRHDTNLGYLLNKTNAINQKMRLTIAVLIDTKLSDSPILRYL